jgi:hypothetical protein
MALATCDISCSGQPVFALVFKVARVASRSKSLTWVMAGRIVACKACAVFNIRAEPGILQMAQATILAKGSVGGRQRPATINSVVPYGGRRYHKQNGDSRNCNRQ